jgi:hypothetical protein
MQRQYGLLKGIGSCMSVGYQAKDLNSVVSARMGGNGFNLRVVKVSMTRLHGPPMAGTSYSVPYEEEKVSYISSQTRE